MALELAFRARLQGSTHLQLQKLNPATTRTTEQPARTPNKRGYHYHGAPPVLPRANLYALASPTRTYSLQVPRSPTPGDVYHTKLMGTHSDLLLSHGPRSGATPPTRTRLPPHKDPDKARRAQTHCASRKTASRSASRSDLETQADLSIKAATRPAVWRHYPHELRPS